MDTELRQKIGTILALFDGRETAIASAGRENTKAVNRLARVAALRRVSGETTFRQNVACYAVEGVEERVIIGAERAGEGKWRLIARWDLVNGE